MVSTYKIEQAKKEIIEALDSLASDAIDDAQEKILSDPKAAFKSLFADELYIHVNGIGYRGPENLSPFSIYLTGTDLFSGEQLLAFDPISETIGFIEEDRLSDEEASEIISRSIATLQSGIDRLKAYEAERLKAQP